MDFSVPINVFVDAARDFCAWCETPRVHNPARLAFETSRHLARLYAAAIELPEVDLDDYPEPEPVSIEAKRSMFVSFAALPFNYYREVFYSNSEHADEPVVGDLADDLTDIYCDLHVGLAIFDSGNESAAVWYWRFSFGAHWGRHAVCALRAIHCHESLGNAEGKGMEHDP